MASGVSYCPACGASNRGGARFCNDCGTALAKGSGRETRKVVTALFADTVGSTALAERLDPEDFRQLVGDGVKHIVEEVERFGGAVKDLAGDGALALFGAPVAHEDDPERAVLAGLRIVERIHDYAEAEAGRFGVEGFNVRVGIETGLVVLGQLGTGGKTEYGAMGDALNTAARLQGQAAPGAVLVGERTQRAIEPLFEWGEARPLDLKGKAEPVTAYEALRQRDAPSPRRRSFEDAEAPLVGREAELEAGSESLRALALGSGGILLVSGEAGHGKTRFLGELRAALEDSPPDDAAPLWLDTRCVSYGETLPYAPFRGLLRTWLRTPGEPSPGVEPAAALRSRLEPLFGSDADELLPLLGSVLGVPLEGEQAAALEALSPEFRQHRIFEAVTALLSRISEERPLIVSIDDLHWADPSSISLTEHLLALSERSACLLVLAARPEPDGPIPRLREVATSEFGDRTRELSLGALANEADSALLAGLIGSGTLPTEVERRVLERAEGNPLYIEELVRSLVDAGALVREQAGWRFDHHVRVEIPDTLEKIVLARIDRLSQPCHEVLGAASVVGRRFDLSVLEAVADSNGAVDDGLRELQQLDLVREVRSRPQPEYRFKHPLIRETVYNSLLKSRRQELHRRAAETLATLLPRSSGERDGVLAHHYSAAGQHEQALEHHTRAAQAAARLYAVAEAVEHCTGALEAGAALGLGLEDAAVRRLTLDRGWMIGDTGRTVDALSDIEAVRQAAALAGDRADEVEALSRLGGVRRMGGDWSGSIRDLEAASALAAELGEPAVQVAALSRLSIVQANELRLDLALDYAQGASQAAGEAGDEELLAVALDSLKLAALYLGDLEALEDATGRLSGIRSRAGDLWLLQWALLESAFVPMATGRWQEAEARAEEALDANRRSGASGHEPLFLDALCRLERSRGDYGRALGFGQQAAQAARRGDVDEWAAWTDATLGWTLLDLQSPADAAARLEDGLAAAERAGARAQLLRCLALLALAEQRRGAQTRALELADRAEALVAGITAPPGGVWLFGAHVYEALARVRLGAGELERASALIAPVAQAAEREGWLEAAAGAALVGGEIAAAAGQRSNAEALLSRALELGAGIPTPEWQTHAALARLLAPDDAQRAHDHAILARSLVERLATTIEDDSLRRSLTAAVPAVTAEA